MLPVTHHCSKSWGIRPLTLADAAALLQFYQSLSTAVRTSFYPFGWQVEVTETHIVDSLKKTDAGRNIDLGLIGDTGILAGHAFIWSIDTPKPVFGIGLQEYLHGRGWGRKLAETILQAADDRKLPLVTLVVLKTNLKAKAMYETLGFILKGQQATKGGDSFYMERYYSANRGEYCEPSNQGGLFHGRH